MLPKHAVIIDRLRSYAETEPCVAAAWIEGSVATGTADHLSDVDAFVAVNESAYGDADLCMTIASFLDEVLLCRRFYAGGPACSAVLASGVDVDLFIRPGDRPVSPTVDPLILYDPQGLVSLASEVTLQPSRAQILLSNFWYFAHY